ncbi:MAG TPA: hypothetical protein VFN51_00390 [Candidatus Saccharimonadales bacterium]|nr:hypothetical protein [Candidatus Saccharimonadales bacterium]
MQKSLSKLKELHPSLRFNAGDQFCWSPETNEIIYKKNARGNQAIWSLLHETGHALLGHQTYQADFELIKLEVSAWEKACELAKSLDTIIDEDHIQDCLDTYRDWLYKRSICPGCSSKCLQQSDYVHYRCFNCHTVWRVTSNRFCRAYRSTKNVHLSPVFHLQTDLK